jgi:hypothetical protein
LNEKERKHGPRLRRDPVDGIGTFEGAMPAGISRYCARSADVTALGASFTFIRQKEGVAMPLSFEERYADVLQNIEFAIVDTDRRLGDALDYHVDAGLEAAVARYAAEQQGRAPREVTLEGARREMYEAVRNVCEWRLGRQELPDAPGQPEPKTVEEVVMCLKRVRKSVQRWTKQAGRRGYLDFVSSYVG